jgi:hypothetical protein
LLLFAVDSSNLVVIEPSDATLRFGAFSTASTVPIMQLLDDEIVIRNDAKVISTFIIAIINNDINLVIIIIIVIDLQNDTIANA